MLLFQNPGSQLDAADIVTAQQRMGVEIPAELVAFYLKQNGGKPRPRCYVNGRKIYVIHEFLRVEIDSDDEGGMIRTYNDLSRNCDWFPSGLFPFAVDPFGDYYVYSLRDESFGRILCVRGEYFHDPDRYIQGVCQSFGEFLAGFAEPEIP